MELDEQIPEAQKFHNEKADMDNPISMSLSAQTSM